MTRWDDSVLRIPAADLVDAELAAADARNSGAPPEVTTAAEAAYAEAAEVWADAEAAWQEGLTGGWLDPEAEAGG